MAILRDKIIKVSEVKPEDKMIKNITGSMMSIQIDGNATLSMKGAHTNFESDEFYDIAMINMTTLGKTTQASEPGLYMVIVEGIDEIKTWFNSNEIKKIQKKNKDFVGLLK